MLQQPLLSARRNCVLVTEMHRQVRQFPSAPFLVVFIMGLLIPVIPSSSVTMRELRGGTREQQSYTLLHHHHSSGSLAKENLRLSNKLTKREPAEYPFRLANQPNHFPAAASIGSGKRKIIKTNSIGFEEIISTLPFGRLGGRNVSGGGRFHRHVGSSSSPSLSSVPAYHGSTFLLHVPPQPLSLIQSSPNSSIGATASGIFNDEEEERNDEVATETWESWAQGFPPGVTCRFRRDLPPIAFQMHTCAWCYMYIPDILTLFGKPSKKVKLGSTKVLDPVTGLNHTVVGLNINGTMILANISDSENPVYSTFANRDARRRWTDCCKAAERCCKSIYRQPPMAPSDITDLEIKDPEPPDCPATWDGWQCWPETSSGTIVQTPCPIYIYFISDPPSCPASVPKKCEATGHWQTKIIKGSESEWTNYGTCASTAVQVQKKRVHVHVIAYAVSIVALIPAIILFFVYKQLRVHRIIIHQNFFLSLLINSVLVIAFKTFVVLNDLSTSDPNSSMMTQNGVGCRLLFILTKYSRLTNYMWMFCEGYYLHKLIAAAFAEQKSLLVFYLIGWVFPLVPTLAYAILRVFVSNDRCWVIPQEAYEWVLNLPSLLSLLVNFGFLINIIRVLVTKLRATHTMEQNQSQYKKAVRATLVLLPLFGTHFVVTIYRPPPTPGACEWIEYYYYVDYILDGLQGFLVALIFCYVNGEVVSLVKRSYSRWQEQRSAGCQRQQSRQTNARSNGRGRSVVSTHYSSVPASPEPGSLTRLTISHNNEINRADPLPSVGEYNNGAPGEGRKFWLTNGKPIHRGNSSSADEDTEVAWTDIRLGSHVQQDDSLELRLTSSTTNKSEKTNTTPASITPALASAPIAVSTDKNNGNLVEHQL